MKEFKCITGPSYDPNVARVELNGFDSNEALTPQMARRAAKVAFGHSRGVTVWSDDAHGYALYSNSHRRLVREE